MGPSTLRRDILSNYRDEKKTLGIGRGSRRSRRGGRASRDRKCYLENPHLAEMLTYSDAAVPTAGLAALSVKSQTSARAPTATSDKENDNRNDEDEDEFFDAEDASLGGHTVPDDAEELDHEAVN